ncbi:MAG: hypothetical protein IPG45_05570 [Deltaproteobacteria bacterium]|nr:hypothetical protein [Deltaproteobacteria bacterium]
MAEVGCVDGKISLGGVDLGTKSMNNIMQSAEAWAQGILAADREVIKNATSLNATNVRGNRGNSNLYGALSLGLAVTAGPAESRDPTVRQAFDAWAKNLNACENFKPRLSYKPQDLLNIAVDAVAAAGQLRANIKELIAEAEIGPNENRHWTAVADGLADYAVKLKGLHAAICVKQDPPITLVNLDIAPPQH